MLIFNWWFYVWFKIAQTSFYGEVEVDDDCIIDISDKTRYTSDMTTLTNPSISPGNTDFWQEIPMKDNIFRIVCMKYQSFQ